MKEITCDASSLLLRYYPLIERGFRLSHFEVAVFAVILVFLIVLSGFFSAAETGLMAINRYRLRHKARMKKRSAVLILKMLKRPDRLLGMILIGNNCSNIIASALATVLALHLFGEKAVIISTVLLTIVVLIFAEVAPKTLAALYPDQISRIVALPVYGMLKLFYPIVWVLNTISNSLLRIFGVKVSNITAEPISREELRSVVYETSGRISSQYQNMLLGILDLNKVSVEDVMIPRHEIVGIDLEQDWETILKQLSTSNYDWLPVYEDNINQVTGFLHLRELMRESLSNTTLDREKLVALLHEAYFIPEGTPLNIQLLSFQHQHKRMALVVDEYGEVQGLVTLVDILEEIVGEFTTTVATTGKIIEKQTDGSFLVDGAITVRELNRLTQFKFSKKGPRTLSGLIIEYLEAIPRPGICVRIADYPIEIVEVKNNRVKVARIFPRLTKIT